MREREQSRKARTRERGVGRTKEWQKKIKEKNNWRERDKKRTKMREGEREGKVSRDPIENAEGENKGEVRKRTKES